MLGCQEGQKRRGKGSHMRNQNQLKFQELAQSSDVGNASKLATIGPLVTKGMVHLLLVIEQPMDKVVLLLQTSQILHDRNQHP
jgi:hypothetical protein